MPRFHYKAKEGPTKIIDGTIEADTLDGAISKIIGLRLTPLDVVLENQQEVEKKAKATALLKTDFNFFKRVGLKDVVLFTRQMSDLIEASVPLLRSIQIVSNQTQNIYFKGLIQNMATFVKDGGSFSESLSKHPQIFSNLYVNMVKTGEVGGQLELVLKRLAIYLEKEHETRSKVRSSLAYPALILVVGVITIFVLLTFVIPRLTVMFEDLNQSLPTPTLILIQMSNVFAQYWWLMIIVVVLVAVYFKKWSNSENGRLWLDSSLLKIPLLGNFIRIVEVGRLARTLGTLLESGVTMTKALKSVAGLIDNVVLREEVRRMSEEVTQGSSLRNALKQCSYFPEMAVNMISVGEETGRLDHSLYKVAETFEREADETVKSIVSLVGPLVLVVVISIVGFVVISMLLPIFQMNLIVQ